MNRPSQRARSQCPYGLWGLFYFTVLPWSEWHRGNAFESQCPYGLWGLFYWESTWVELGQLYSSQCPYGLWGLFYCTRRLILPHNLPRSRHKSRQNSLFRTILPPFCSLSGPDTALRASPQCPKTARCSQKYPRHPPPLALTHPPTTIPCTHAPPPCEHRRNPSDPPRCSQRFCATLYHDRFLFAKHLGAGGNLCLLEAALAQVVIAHVVYPGPDHLADRALHPRQP